MKEARKVDTPLASGGVPVLQYGNRRVRYRKPGQSVLAQQVSEVLGLTACGGASASILSMVSWSITHQGKYGAISCGAMIFTGLVVFAGDVAARPGPKPKSLLYAVIGTLLAIVYFVAIDFLQTPR